MRTIRIFSLVYQHADRISIFISIYYIIGTSRLAVHCITTSKLEKCLAKLIESINKLRVVLKLLLILPLIADPLIALIIITISIWQEVPLL
jgi:TRAP-type C4-dicarboxylate transport system permease large subunit